MDTCKKQKVPKTWQDQDNWTKIKRPKNVAGSRHDTWTKRQEPKTRQVQDTLKKMTRTKNVAGSRNFFKKVPFAQIDALKLTKIFKKISIKIL